MCNSGAFPWGFLAILSKFMLCAVFQQSQDPSSYTTKRLRWRETLVLRGMRLCFPAEDETKEEGYQLDPTSRCPGRSEAEVYGDPEGTEHQRRLSYSCSPSHVTWKCDHAKEPDPVKSKESGRECDGHQPQAGVGFIVTGSHPRFSLCILHAPSLCTRYWHIIFSPNMNGILTAYGVRNHRRRNGVRSTAEGETLS